MLAWYGEILDAAAVAALPLDKHGFAFLDLWDALRVALKGERARWPLEIRDMVAKGAKVLLLNADGLEIEPAQPAPIQHETGGTDSQPEGS